MEKPNDPSLLQEYRNEFTRKFAPLQLWNDRRRILADPAIAAQSPSPLANSPVRFALSLQLVPILFIGWVVGTLSGLIGSSDEQAAILGGKLTPTITLLEERVGPVSEEEVLVRARLASVDQMHPHADELWMELVTRMSFRHAASDHDALRNYVVQWLDRLEASEIAPAHREVLTAKALTFVGRLSRNEKQHDKIMRSMTEGGLLMQVSGAFTLLFGAWVLGRMLRGDARFPLAARADRFYLYYSTSHVFWLLVLKLLCFGVGSVAYAAGNASLFSNAQLAQLGVAGVTAAWLLSRSGEMARVLSQTNPAPRGTTFAIGWRMVAAMLISTITILVIAILIGLLAGIAMAMWQR